MGFTDSIRGGASGAADGGLGLGFAQALCAPY